MALAIAVQQLASDAEDSDLVRRIAVGDRAAFEQLYLRYHRRLTRFLMRFADRYDLAEEAINDTLYVVWNKASTFRGDSKVSTWIFGIAYRRAIKSFKQLELQHKTEGTEAEQVVSDVFPDASQEQSDWIARGMAHLPFDQRAVIEMAYFLGHSCEEIAQVMDCPVNTVKTRMFHARRRLRELLPQLAEPVARIPREQS